MIPAVNAETNVGKTQKTIPVSQRPGEAIIRFYCGGPELPPRLVSGRDGLEISSHVYNVFIHPEVISEPRGVEWTDLPVVRPPAFTLRNQFPIHTEMQPYSGDDISASELIYALSGQSHVIFDESLIELNPDGPAWYDRRYDAAQLFRRIAPGKPVLFRGPESRRFTEKNVVDLEFRGAGWKSLSANYKFNFKAIGSKAISHVIDKYSCLPDFDPSQAKTFEDRIRLEQRKLGQQSFVQEKQSYLNVFWSLQILFALRDATEAEQHELYLDHASMANFHSRIIEGPGYSFGRKMDKGRWVGSGKYAHSIDLKDETTDAIWTGVCLGLIDDKSGERLRLTDAGLAFLDIMHKDNNDPDALLRFLNPKTMAISAVELERTDAWLIPFFRKMKTRVNAI